jgi:hypothetical protein
LPGWRHDEPALRPQRQNLLNLSAADVLVLAQEHFTVGQARGYRRN